MRIAVVKPDYGIQGGFERVLGRIVKHLRRSGHDVRWLAVDARNTSAKPYGRPVPAVAASLVPDFVDYFGLAEQFDGIDASRCDVVISTQPPSFVVRHPRHLSIFYHHLRGFYDLADVSMAAGLVDVDSHMLALDHVRRFDQICLDRVTWFLAGSEVVAERLAAFNGLASNVSVLHAGLGVGDDADCDGHADLDDAWVPAREASRTGDDGSTTVPALCVSRHEFPKRTELFVHAMALLEGEPGVAVGAGGRLGWAKRLHLEFADGTRNAVAADSRALWLTAPGYIPPEAVPDPTCPTVEFLGEISDEELDRLYFRASCVVAPAYLEDYGLTAIEAMMKGKPVIVCGDGGGLTSLVRHEVNGLVVEPSGPAIAAAIERLRGDPGLARELGEQGRRIARTYTWTRAMREFDHGLAQVLS